MEKNNEPVDFMELVSTWKSYEKWKWYNHVWWWIRYGIWNWITDLKWKVPNSIERARRGWGHADTWNFDYHLAKIISEGLKHLKTYKHGYPVILPTLNEDGTIDHSKVDEDVNLKLWDKILEDMIYTFETALKIADHDTIYVSSKDWTEELYQKNLKFAQEMNEKFPDLPHNVMTKEEVERYENGWKYFQEYFYNLWD